MLLILGLVLVVVTLALRTAVRNRHVRGRLFASAAVFAAFAAVDAVRLYATLSPEFTTQIVLIRPLLLALGAINAAVALLINPWRADRLPDRFPTIVQDAVTIALFALAAILVLQERVLTTTAVGAVVIGFALQDTLGNLFAGLAIQIEKPFGVGHWVNVAGKDGIVTEITWRATKLRTKAGNLVVVPNSALARETITNYSEPNHFTRVEIDVGAAYDAPPNEVKDAILGAVALEPAIVRQPAPDVIVQEFADYSIVYRVRVWIDNYAVDDKVRDRVRSLIYYVFRRRGITIPFPTEVQIKQEPIVHRIDPQLRAASVDAVEIFAGLSEHQRAALAAASRWSVYSTGEPIVRQGAAGSSMFIVTSGEAVVTLEPSQQEVSRVTRGGFFGEMSLLTGAARTATVTAASDCGVLEITADAFRTFVLADPAVVEQVGAAVAKRAADLAELRSANEANARPPEPPSSFIARARRFLRLSVPVYAVLAIWPANATASEPMQLPSADGRRVVTALEVRSPITLDGALDEEVWQLATAADSFVQAEPHEGQPATELTDVRLAFDRDALYIGVTCHDATPDALIVNDIRKDFSAGEQDTFEVLLDTFADRRNGFVFVTNARGAKSDTQIANEGRDVNTSWDAVWTVATRTTSDGWSAEFRIPFKTLRFESGAGRIWGVNFSRRIRRKNEIDFWSAVPRVYNLYRAGLAGTLAGLPDASQGRNIRVKPWVASNSTRAVGATVFDNSPHVGLDAKYGVTPSLTLDVTARPDFAQAEADEQQVNLTQFSLFFPEKREFFLENSGLFYFGDIPRESRLGNARFAPPEEEMLLFFSRRIGLTADGREIPIAAGGRLTGRVGRTGLGAMTIQTQGADGRDGENYTVLRGRRDVLRNSDVGAIFLSRQSAGLSRDRNEVAGVDANFRFIRALSINGFLSRSASPGSGGGQMAGKGSIVWNDNRVHTQYSLLSVGDNFRDDIGFIKRTGIRKHFVDFGIRKRYEGLRKYGIRELHPHTRYNIYTDQSNLKVTHTNHIAMAAFFERGGYVEVQWNPRFEHSDIPVKIRRDQSFAPGSYGWNEYAFELETNHSRKVSGSALLTSGGFWMGNQKSTKAGVTVRPSFHLTLDLALQRNDITLPAPYHDFVTNLVTSRVGYAFNTKTFLDTLLQYNTDLKQFSANVRLDVIHRPLSDLFLVYNEQQLTDQPTPVNAGRGLIVKYTHMLAF